LAIDYDYISFLVNSIDYDYSKNCNRLRLTIAITPCLVPLLAYISWTPNNDEVKTASCFSNES